MNRFRNTLLYRNYGSVFRKEFRILYYIYFMFFLFHSMFENSVPLLFQTLGHSEKLYSMLLSAENLCGIILPGLISYLAIRCDYFKVAYAGISISVLGAFLLGSVSPAAGLVAAGVLLNAGRGIFNFSFGNAVNTEIKGEKRAKYLVIRDFFLFLGCGVGLLIGSRWTAKFGMPAMYRVMSWGFILTCLGLIAYKKTKCSNIVEAKQEDRHLRLRDWTGLLRRKKTLGYIAVNMLTMVYGVSQSFLPLLGLNIGIDTAHIMSILGFTAFTNTIFALFMANISDTRGRKWFFTADIAVDIIPSLIFAFTSSIPMYVAGLVFVMIKDAFAPISFAYFYDCFEGDEAVAAMGLCSSVTGVLGLCMPILIGWLWTRSTTLVFLTGAVANLLAVVAAVCLLPEKNCNGIQ